MTERECRIRNADIDVKVAKLRAEMAEIEMELMERQAMMQNYELERAEILRNYEETKKN